MIVIFYSYSLSSYEYITYYSTSSPHLQIIVQFQIIIIIVHYIREKDWPQQKKILEVAGIPDLLEKLPWFFLFFFHTDYNLPVFHILTSQLLRYYFYITLTLLYVVGKVELYISNFTRLPTRQVMFLGYLWLCDCLSLLLSKCLNLFWIARCCQIRLWIPSVIEYIQTFPLYNISIDVEKPMIFT